MSELEIRIPNGNNLTLIVTVNHTLANVKQMVMERTGIPINNQKLSFGNYNNDQEVGLRNIAGRCHRSRSLPSIIQTNRRSCGRECVNLNHHPHIKLEDQMLLSSYRLVFRQGLTLCYCPSMKIRFSIVWRNTINVLEVKSTDTIRDIKRKLGTKYGLDAHQMLLTYQGRFLDDGRNVASYNICHDAAISVGFQFHFRR